MNDLADFWTDLSRTFPGCKMRYLETETFACGVYTPYIRTGDESRMQLPPVDLGPLPRPKSEIEDVRAYSLARHLRLQLDGHEVIDLMEVIKLHEPPEFIESVRSAYKNLSTISK